MVVHIETRTCRQASPLVRFGLCLLLCIAVPAGAVEYAELFTAEVPLDLEESNPRSVAYRDALNVVLVRVTGNIAAPQDETLGALFAVPDALVTRFQQAPDNHLRVTFDGMQIERVLRQSGQTYWGIDRPLTIIWLGVDRGLGEREIVAAESARPLRTPTAEQNRALRERIEAVASLRGLPIVFPRMDEVDIDNIGFADLWGGFDEPLREASARYAADSVLVGRVRVGDPDVPRWTWYNGEERFGWPGELEAAIHQLADSLVARDAVHGDEALVTVTLTISGIHSVEDYARVQRAMENLRAAERVQIREATPGSLRYDVDIRGGESRLNGLLRANPDLEAESSLDAGNFGYNNEFGGPAGGSLRYRYRAPQPPMPDPLAIDSPVDQGLNE